MAEQVYGSLEFSPKPQTTGSDIAKGSLGVPNLNAPLFLELRLIRTHTHTGIDTLTLSPEATPFMVRGSTPREREEKGVITWAGGSTVAASVTLTFATPFSAIPNVFAVASANDDRILVAIGNITKTGCSIYWRDVTGVGHVSIPIQYLVKGN